MLANRRATLTSRLRFRKKGLPERMSATSGAGRSSEATTGVGIRPLPRRGVLIATDSVWQAPEGVVGRLVLAGDGHQTGLPAGEAALVTEQEPEHHADARVLAGDRVRLRQVPRLLRPADAEVRVGRPGLVAVLGDPERLVAVELRQQLDQDADVPERDGRLRLRRRRRALGRARVVRMVRVD